MSEISVRNLEFRTAEKLARQEPAILQQPYRDRFRPDITVREVVSRADLKAFIRLPDALYRDDPHWIRPLMPERLALLDQTKNPYFRHADARYFLAFRNGQAVGRISAQVDRLLEQRTGERIGHFGLFESIEDRDVVAHLFATAEDWLAQKGCVRVEGPFNLSTNGECGLLIEGFDTPPAVMMGHARPWYGAAIDALGYRKARDLYAYQLDLTLGPPPRTARILEMFGKSADFRIRQIDMKRYQDELRIIVDIFNDAWSDNWGFVPLEPDEAQHLARELRPLIAAHRVCICEHKGESVAMFVAIPDVNQAIAKSGGDMLPFGWLKLLTGLYGRYPQRMRTPLMGVRKQLQGSRWGGALALAMIETVRPAVVERGANWAELSWILEDNIAMRNILVEIGCEIYKTYRIYSKSLT